jgi:hypothetical protein
VHIPIALTKLATLLDPVRTLDLWRRLSYQPKTQYQSILVTFSYAL